MVVYGEITVSGYVGDDPTAIARVDKRDVGFGVGAKEKIGKLK